MSETATLAAVPVENTSEEKVYTLRKLEARDVALMVSIVSKIGVTEFRKMLMSDDMQALFSAPTDMGEKTISPEAAGIGMVLEIANMIMSNYSKCESEIFQFLSNLSGMSKKSIESLPFDTFFEMIIDVVRKEEFKAFMKVVSKLFK